MQNGGCGGGVGGPELIGVDGGEHVYAEVVKFWDLVDRCEFKDAKCHILGSDRMVVCYQVGGFWARTVRVEETIELDKDHGEDLREIDAAV